MPQDGVPRFDAEGPYATLSFPSRYDLLGRTIRFDTRCDMAGPGILSLRNIGVVDTRVLVLSTPADDETTDLRLLVSAASLGGLPLSSWVLARIARFLTKRDVDKEVGIWNHKRYLARPTFVGPRAHAAKNSDVVPAVLLIVQSLKRRRAHRGGSLGSSSRDRRLREFRLGS